MKILVISQPKSGTYLCANILQNLGLDFTWMHIGAKSYDKYDPNNLKQGRKYPQRFRYKSTMKESAALVADNQFAVGHIDYSEKAEEIFKDFKKIILYRDPREAGESWNRWKKESGRSMTTKKSIPNAKIIEWQNKENTITLNFDAMINKNIQKIDALQFFLFEELKYNSDAIIEKSLAQDSLTKSTNRC
jgi:hypothetical protein